MLISMIKQRDILKVKYDKQDQQGNERNAKTLS
jgi:hypothetical protein